MVWIVKTDPAVTEAMTSDLEPYADRVLTMTLENGKEFAGMKRSLKLLRQMFDSLLPMHLGRGGTNENTNGLLSQYFSKKRKLNDVSKYEIKYVENRLNRRPRKKLGFKTLYEVFFNTTELLTVALRT